VPLRPFDQIPRLSEFVGELSFSGTPELGFSKILLVESRTDIRSIQQLLRKLKKEHAVLLLPLAGNTLINNHPDTEAQLLELTRIAAAGNIKALIDSERTSASAGIAADRQGFQNVCNGLGIDCHILELRALETTSLSVRLGSVSVPVIQSRAVLVFQIGTRTTM
jgi:hypothetical protein